LELEVRHVELERFGGSIIVPQFKAALNVIKGNHPLPLDVAFECSSEDRREFLDMLLQADDITIQSKHVVNTFVLEALNVYRFILLKLNQISNFMVFGDQSLLDVVETQIKCVNSHWVLALFHGDDINFSQSVPGFQRHQTVKRLCEKDLHLIELTKLFHSIGDLHV
jgi:hypothetical protein